jgi:hypothetical protein
MKTFFAELRPLYLGTEDIFIHKKKVILPIYLGIYLNSSLGWAEQINNVAAKA